jgi:uncharacterized FAD-dependent dehydrogenase
LTTRIGKNSANVRWVLEEFVKYGAPDRILVDGKPHLGTDRLVRILKSMREHLEERYVYECVVFVVCCVYVCPGCLDITLTLTP